MLGRLLDPALTAVRGPDAWFAGAMAGLAVLAGASWAPPWRGLRGSPGGRRAGPRRRARCCGAPSPPRGAARERVRHAPFPEEWRRILEDRYDHYHRLPPDLRRRFEEHVALFLAEKRITGVEVEADLELRLLVAASAATLTAGWEGDHWDHLAEVLLYPQDFGRDYSFDEDELSGQAHPWGTIILSVPTLEDSFDDPDDGFHVGLHEFAHLLDVEQTRFDGVPRGLDPARSRRVAGRRRPGDGPPAAGKSVLDPYAAESPAEFLAVAVETFFESPLRAAPAPPRGLRHPARLLRRRTRRPGTRPAD